MAPRLALIGSRSRATITVDTFTLEIMPQELNWRNIAIALIGPSQAANLTGSGELRASGSFSGTCADFVL
jgi:hypothetical protein